MKRFWKKGLMVIAGLMVCGVAVSSYSGGALAGTVKAKCVDKDTGKPQPAEFNARSKDSVDFIYVCTSADGSGCEISVPDAGPYEVRCFPLNVEYGQPAINISIVQGSKQYGLEKDLFIVDDGATAEFKSYEKKLTHSTY